VNNNNSNNGDKNNDYNIWKRYQESMQQIRYKENSCTTDIAHNKESAAV